MSKPKRGGANLETCKEVAQFLGDYVSGRLTVRVRRKSAEHLRICPDCVSFLNTYRSTIAATSKLRADRLPAKVRDSVLGFLRAKIHRMAALIVSALTQFFA